MSTIRVRFAPSPTGYLHVGGARTALFNLLFARRTGGTFALRIEDTDKERSSDEHVRGILDGMSWLGLSWDEGPVYQSAGYERHRQAALRLVAEGKAYHSFVTQEELDIERSKAEAAGTVFQPTRERLRASPEETARRHAAGEASCVRFMVPAGTTRWNDLIHGETSFANEELEDLVLLRTDGTPIYNLSVVCDDIEMRVTHVVRGDDHISNTPKQILLYEALGVAPPQFGHLPLILGSDKKRLSKRHGATSVLAYREMGIPHEAMLNFLGLLGWSPGGDLELMTFDEMTERFSWDGVGSSGAVFDTEKLMWMSGEHLRHMDLSLLCTRLNPWLSEIGVQAGERGNRLPRFVDLARARARTFVELAAAVTRYANDDVDYDPEAIDKHLNGDAHVKQLAALGQAFALTSSWEPAPLEQALRRTAEELGIAAGKLIHPTRVAVLGVAVSPGIFEVLAAIGREGSLARIARLQAWLSGGRAKSSP